MDNINTGQVRLLAVVVVVGLLAGCTATEMPEDNEGSDEMLKSPCACYQLEYEPRGIQWKRV
mgnify:CR=1 FL=1